VFGTTVVGTVSLKVSAQPKSVISPQTIAAFKGETINLTCSISNVNEVDLSQIHYTWCNDTKIYNGE